MRVVFLAAWLLGCSGRSASETGEPSIPWNPPTDGDTTAGDDLVAYLERYL